MFGPPVTTIRTTPFPHQPPPGLQPDAGKMAAQRAFFATLTGKAEAVTDNATAPATTSPPVSRSAAPSEPPSKILRPGSLIDIRV
jgi:hypothetical protein